MTLFRWDEEKQQYVEGDVFDFPEYAKELLQEFSGLLEEALEWTDNPVRDQDDAVYFIDFQKRCREALEKVKEPNV